MKRPQHPQRLLRHRALGFTLVELVVALVITAIVIGLAALVITKPVEAYFDTAERAERTEAAQLVSRRLSDDLRHAVPNSVRITTNGSQSIIEMLRYERVSFFRRAGELPGPGPWPQADRELDASINDSTFSVFGRLDPARSSPYRFDHLVVINNLGDRTMFDAYEPGNVVMTPSPPQIDVNRDASLEERVTLTPGFRFQSAGTPGFRQRAFFVSGAVTYVCNSTANIQTMRRFDGYVVAPAIPAGDTDPRLLAGGVRNALLANDVSACRLECAGGTTQPCLGGLVLEYTISRTTSGGDEPTRMLFQFPIDNAL